MILGYALITVKPEHRDDYIQTFYRLRDDVRQKDPGTTRYDLHQRRDDPNKFIVIEEYTDQAGLDQHMDMQHARPWVRHMMDHWMDECDFHFCNPLHYNGEKVA